LCDRLTILRSGKILASDTPKEIMSRGKVVIRLHREGGTEEITVDHYPDRLPEVLRRYGLNPDIQKIEVEEQTLESIIVGMIEGEV
jgi:ABC-type multidrug transport system ATPase subunit